MDANWKTETYTLAHPIAVGENVSITRITLKEPDVDALEAIEDVGIEAGKRPTVKQLRAVLVALGDLAPDQIGKLHKDDFQGVCEKLIPLLEWSGDTPPAEPSAPT